MRVRVLGQLTVTDDNGVSLGAAELPRRARQVLAVLAARHGRIQSKDALADAVWGTNLPGNHVAALEHYASVVRRRLQPKGTAASWFIVTRSGGYVFDTSRASLDLADLRNLIRGLDALPPDGPERLALHEEILGLAAELPFPEDPYADWAESARNEVQIAGVNARLELAAAALPRDAARALRLAQEAIELDPFLEPGYAAAMDAAVALGRPDDALRLFERCKRAARRGTRCDAVGRPGPDAACSAGRPARWPGAGTGSGRRTADRRAARWPRRAGRRSYPAKRFSAGSPSCGLLIDPEPPALVHVVGPGRRGQVGVPGRAQPQRTGPGRHRPRHRRRSACCGSTGCGRR